MNSSSSTQVSGGAWTYSWAAHSMNCTPHAYISFLILTPKKLYQVFKYWHSEISEDFRNTEIPTQDFIQSQNGFGWEWPQRSPSSNPPTSQHCQSLDQAAQEPIQPDLELSEMVHPQLLWAQTGGQDKSNMGNSQSLHWAQQKLPEIAASCNCCRLPTNSSL